MLTHDAPSRFLDFTSLAVGESNRLHLFLDKVLLKLTYDKDGYVTKAVVVDNTASDIYGSSDFNASKDINPDIFKAYEVKHNQPKGSALAAPCTPMSRTTWV